MIPGIVGFAGRVRSEGGEVGAAELIDCARALLMVDVADRSEVQHAIRSCLSWAAVDPDRFERVFDEWFSGAELLELGNHAVVDDQDAVVISVETTDAAGVHDEEATLVDETSAEPIDRPSEALDEIGFGRATGLPASDGAGASALGEPDAGSSAVAGGELAHRRPEVHIRLPVDAETVDLEAARLVLEDAVEARSSTLAVATLPRVSLTSEPLAGEERQRIDRAVRQLARRFDGSPSWQRRRGPSGAVDLRRTLRQAVTTAGRPVEVCHVGPRTDAARVIVLVDLSLSVRGSSRLVLHVLHRLRSSVGSVRAFGFVDRFVPIDRALRVGEASRAIEAVLSLVDVDANSDPGQAFRSWWHRWQHLVTPTAHVLVLSDGRCNGHDPAFDVIRRLTRRSASTTWISPEPPGAWSMGRGEMSGYASCVDQAVTLRSLEDLERFARPL